MFRIGQDPLDLEIGGAARALKTCRKESNRETQRHGGQRAGLESTCPPLGY